MRREVKEMKRRRAEESADGLALMTSSVMSSYSEDGLREQSQESAVAIQEAKKSRKLELEREGSAGSLCQLAVEKMRKIWNQMRREVKEMKRRRAEESADGLALMTSSVTSSYSADDSADALCVEIQQLQDTSWKLMFNTSWTTRRKQQQHPVVSYNESAVAIYPVASYSRSSHELQCYFISSRHGIPDARKEEVAKHGKQTQDIQS
ncbi:hypothetical protein F511_29518 [Dorcoceras hygrometricum]|uniref:Uncharacterized protein n=1 Tax=Dorcoceras hygrometricum TaxID=472368 RepID=A0A2Z7DE09_9LAMI|nr:hypothetical protein F511_29518 [Dorcoceras hygrometricum]